MPRLILASASPQRKTLLASLGLTFDVIPSRFSEQGHPELNPLDRAKVLAREKAQEVAAKHPGAWVIGADTLVVASDGTLLEKPKDEADARHMLKLHSGSLSTVHSALCLITPKGTEEGVSSSIVHFRKLAEKEIDWWIATGQWKDRSGAFQIEAQGQLMIERIEGDYAGIVGFPIFLFGQLMKKAGWNLTEIEN